MSNNDENHYQRRAKADPAPFTSTLGNIIGEIVWLITQSPVHRKLQLSDLEWLVYPPVILNQ